MCVVYAMDVSLCFGSALVVLTCNTRKRFSRLILYIPSVNTRVLLCTVLSSVVSLVVIVVHRVPLRARAMDNGSA